eukprot:m.32521 g.32521  ORF g.32521 m.32521 type:complete len:473 (-) comp8422_c0_seq2:184-1602(-)
MFVVVFMVILQLKRVVHVGNIHTCELQPFKDIDVVRGNIILENCPELTDLGGLKSVSIVEGNIFVTNTGITSLGGGFDNLQVVRGSLSLTNNPYLRNIRGFTQLSTVDDDFRIGCAHNISELPSLDNLKTVGGDFIIRKVSLVRGYVEMIGLKMLTSIGGSLFLISISGLETISAFSNLVNVTSLGVYDNYNLSNADGFGSLRQHSEMQYLRVCNNPLLLSTPPNLFALFANLDLLESPFNYFNSYFCFGENPISTDSPACLFNVFTTTSKTATETSFTLSTKSSLTRTSLTSTTTFTITSTTTTSLTSTISSSTTMTSTYTMTITVTSTSYASSSQKPTSMSSSGATFTNHEISTMSANQNKSSTHIPTVTRSTEVVEGSEKLATWVVTLIILLVLLTIGLCICLIRKAITRRQQNNILKSTPVVKQSFYSDGTNLDDLYDSHELTNKFSTDITLDSELYVLDTTHEEQMC